MFTSIRYKLFATLLAAVIIVVVGMFFLIHWSFGRDFLNYVNRMETKRIESLSHDLQEAYTDQKNWKFLQGNLQLWHKFLAASSPDGVQQFDPLVELQFSREKLTQHQSSGPGINNHRSKNHEEQKHRNIREEIRHLFEFRVVLLDAERNLVMGPKLYPVDMEMVTLKHESVIVGYLGHISQKNLIANHQLQFIQQQKKSLTLISILIAALAALIAFPVASRMVRRINSLAKGTHCLAAGQYDTILEEGTLDELGQLTQDFNKLAMTLSKNEQLRKQWVADISHELRTPLAVLQGEIEALQDGVRELSSEAVGSLHSEVLRLNRLVHDLFQLSMSDIGALTYKREMVDIVEILYLSINTFRSKFAQKHIAMELNSQPTGVMQIFGDPERLRQLFYNLLNNSLKYTDPEGDLNVVCRLNNGEAEIIFQDSSPGVPTTDFDKLFDRLFRVESSRSRDSGGAGLGLAICKNIVDAHNGAIEASSSPLGGLLIRVSLPVERSAGL